MSYDVLIKEYSRHFPNDTKNQALIKQAFDFAHSAHRNHKRASGDDYMTHLFETAFKLTSWKMDAETIAAGLLHDCIEDTDISPKELEKHFGEHVSFLVDGVTKLGNLKYSGPQEHSAHNLRRMMLAISKDLRVVFIKLSDRLHNMRTLSHIPAEKRNRIALETMEVYAPLATRLGMQSLAGDLQDLAFPHLHPTEYKWLKENVKEPYEARERYLKEVEPIVRKELKNAGIVPISINYRAKRLYSLYKKLKRYDMSLEQIYDLVALRIIVDTVPECYGVLGGLHQLWPPLPGRIKDYIALPKPNGYQSLHTTVFSLNDRPAEFQIRTPQMHEHAENGAAAHWFYENKKTAQNVAQRSAHTPTKELAWVNQIKDWKQQFPGSKEFVEALKVDLFSDRIFILTPRGRVLDLPSGSTPVDFAYKVHTDIGHSCTGVKVNDKMVSLDTPLQSGDVVEILTQKSKKPSGSWLRLAKTSHAKKKIRSRIRRDSTVPKKTEYRIVGEKHIDLLKNISSIFSRNHIPVSEIEMLSSEGNYSILKVVAEIKDTAKADNITLKLKNSKGVKEVNYKIIQPNIFLTF